MKPMKPTPKQLEIYEVAKKLFVEKGYTETSVRDIAAVLNIKAASLYSHISTKDEILDYICHDVFERLSTGLKNLMHTELPLQQKFPDFIRIYITESLKDIDKFVVYQKYWKLSEKHSEKIADGKNLLHERLKNLLAANLTGDAEMECFVDDSTTLLVLHILQFVPHLVNNKENGDIEAVVPEIQKRLLFGYAK